MLESLTLLQIIRKLDEYEFKVNELKSLEKTLEKVCREINLQIELEGENEILGEQIGFDETDFM